MKRTLSLFLGLILSVPLFARDFTYTYEGQTITYTVLDESAKTCKVARNSNISGELILPEHPMDGNVEYLLTELGQRAFRSCKGLTSVTIPNSVTTIGNNAFQYCSGLTSVEIPNSVTSIGNSAFDYCSGLTSVTIGNSVTSIGNNAFDYCSGLTSVEIPNSATSIGSSAFSNCSGLTSVTIGNSVTSIGNNAFDYCSGLTSVEIPNSVTSIGNNAFGNCRGLTSVTIGNSVTSIGDGAFYYCSDLISIEIPKSVSSIGKGAFGDCYSLRVAMFSDIESLCLIEFGNVEANPLNWAHKLYLGKKKVTEIEIPETITSIKNYTFAGGSSLTSVMLPKSVTSIGNYAFYSCSGLTLVEIPTSVTSIGNFSFSNCSGLTSVTIPNSVTSIGNFAFSGCSGLTSVTVGNSVTSIGDYAFNFCSGLTSFEIPNSVTSIGDYAFSYCSGLTSVEIPNSVTSIGSSAFISCINLTEIVIPPSVKTVGAYAFSGTKLATVSIGYGITDLSTAFDGLTTIKDLYITATNPPVALFSSYNFPVWLVSEEAVDDYDIAIPYWDEFADKRVMTPVTGLSMPKVKVAGKPGDVVSLNVDVEPANASLQHLFYRTNRPDLISVDSKGNVTFLEQEGDVKALADAADCEITVTTMFENGPELKIGVTYGYGESGVEDIVFGNSQNNQSNDIYNMQGVCIKRNASADDVKALAPGLYIVGGKKLLVK